MRNPLRHSLIGFALLVVWIALTSPTTAQEQSVRPGINKAFENPDVKEFLGKFEVESREIYAQRKEIVSACKLKPGMAVADIGAGTGLFTRLFAKEAGPKGKVYAVDIAPKFVEHIEKTATDENLKNIVGVVCTADNVKLPANSIDLAFVCDTYHHFEFPFKTLASIHEALRPGGQLIVIDFHRIEGKSSEWVMGHVRAGQDVFTREITQSGFKLLGEEKLLKENYFLRFEKVTAKIGEAKRDGNGFLSHAVECEYQKGQTEIMVLLPDRLDKDRRYPVLYVLPVEANRENRWGDGLLEVKNLDLHNKLGLIVVQPTFSHLPWYADHPTDPTIRQETYFLKVVVPFIEKSYPVLTEPKGRLLLGFSKSGNGAFTLLLRHPTVFGRAVAWDSPLNMDKPSSYGMGPIYGTQENFEKYRIPDLFQKRAAELGKEKRLALIGVSNFDKHHQAIHELMEKLKIPHEYREDKKPKHHWDAGWVKDAVTWLVSP
jgi:ubiquinone/menaquinone biosynthesis C-methylase UbiE